MTTEYGIFTDEGCIDAGLFSEAEARQVLATYDVDDNARIALICEDHPEQSADDCEGCADEDEDEEDQ